jgi:hypothetical protein
MSRENSPSLRTLDKIGHFVDSGKDPALSMRVSEASDLGNSRQNDERLQMRKRSQERLGRKQLTRLGV